MNRRGLLLAFLLFDLVVCASGQKGGTELPPAASSPGLENLAPTPSLDGPRVAIDTTMGRLTCKLLSTARPAVASFIALADVKSGKSSFDGSELKVRSGKIFGGGWPKAKETTQPKTEAEPVPGFTFDHPGRLALLTSANSRGAQFLITDQPTLEMEGEATVVGQCNAASVRLVRKIVHSVLMAKGAPAPPRLIERVSVVRGGRAMPPPMHKVPVVALPVKRKLQPDSDALTVVLDTTKGRLSCSLFQKEAPEAVSTFVGLAEGTKSWTASPSESTADRKRFYDGTTLIANGLGIMGGDRSGDGKGTAGFTYAAEIVPSLSFDVPGRLAMIPDKSKQNSSRFIILADAAPRLNGKYTIFGQCDHASIEVVKQTMRWSLTDDNDPADPVVIDRVSIVRHGEPLPPIAPVVALSAVVPPPHARPKSPVPPPEPSGPTAVIETSMGSITCRLFTAQAPLATGVFMDLANGIQAASEVATPIAIKGKRTYDGALFYRVIPDFVIQGGDVDGPHQPQIQYKNEVVPGLTFDRPGRLAMANHGIDTNGTQFFITEHPVHRLDGGYTIFGQCDQAAVRTAEKIARVLRDDDDQPENPVVIRHIEIRPDATRGP